MRFGILDMVGLAATLVFAVPVGVFGLRRALAGDALLGGGLVVVAVLMVVLPHALTTPGDLPGVVLDRLLGTALPADDPEDETAGE
jgi:hypothetical protein